MKYFLLILLLYSFVLPAQTMQGVVTDANTQKPLYPATVINVTTQQAAYTNAYGLYTIAANPGDVVAFTYLGYASVEKIQTTSTQATNVAMTRTGYQLGEFKLRPGHMTQYQMDSADRKATYKVTLRRTHPSPIMSPFSALADQFSKKSKRTYRFQKDFYNRESQRFVDTRYTPELVAELTGATGDSIGHFMYAYPMPYDYARNASDLEIKMWIRTNYREWAKKDSAMNASLKKEEAR